MYDAELCFNLHVGDGEKVNFKKPPRLEITCFPEPMDINWNDVAYQMEYSLGIDLAPVVEPVLAPSMWHSLSSTARVAIPTSVLTSPVKKRTFDDICSRSPIKVEGASSPVKVPLFKKLTN